MYKVTDTDQYKTAAEGQKTLSDVRQIFVTSIIMLVMNDKLLLLI